MVFGRAFAATMIGPALVTKGASHLVPQVLLILIGEKLVRLTNSRKWGGACLTCVAYKELQAVAARADGLAALDGILHGTIQDRGRDSLLHWAADRSALLRAGGPDESRIGRR